MDNSGRICLTCASRSCIHLAQSPVVLSELEVRIVGLVGVGATNKSAAFELGLSEAAVKAHLNRIYRKLRIEATGNTRVNLSLWARAHSDVVYSNRAA